MNAAGYMIDIGSGRHNERNASHLNVAVDPSRRQQDSRRCCSRIDGHREEAWRPELSPAPLD